MVLIDHIIESIDEGFIRITDHADEEAANDGFSFVGIYYSVRTGEIVEQYPEDKPYPSCLIFGKNEQEKPIHSVWAYNVLTKASVVITVYRPDPEKWLDWKVRRKL